MYSLHSFLRDSHRWNLEYNNERNVAYRGKDINRYNITLYLHCILDTTVIKNNDNVKHISTQTWHLNICVELLTKCHILNLIFYGKIWIRGAKPKLIICMTYHMHHVFYRMHCMTYMHYIAYRMRYMLGLQYYFVSISLSDTSMPNKDDLQCADSPRCAAECHWCKCHWVPLV